MTRRGLWVVGSAVLLGTVASLLEAHDLFLKPADFFVAPGSSVNISVLNGTFTTSEGAVVRERLRDLSVAGPDGVAHPATDSWTARDKKSLWHVRVGRSGTYILGAAVLPRALPLDAKEFNSYLQEDGLPDVLAARRANGELDKPARERYSKHVKTLIQVGGRRDTQVDNVFGYAAELIPLANPYRLKAGETLKVRALVDGRPIANQVVLAGGHTRNGARIAETSLRTDKDGIAGIRLRSRGVWYVKFINMRRIDPAAHDTVDYESKWATLTFALR